MKMKTASNKKQRKPVILIAGIVAALFCSAGIATIRDWNVSPGKTLGERTGLIALLKGGDANRGAVDRYDTRDAIALTRPTARCAGCGVIESILVVEMRDETTGVCAAGDWVDHHGFLKNTSVEAGGRNLATLAEIVGDVVVSNVSARNMRSAAGYELTIRFPNGARSTIRLASQPRWKPGERVLVINNQT
jgi:outer membrane lipoprotein SlyB